METTSLGFPLETVLVFIGIALAAIFIDLYAHRKDRVLSLKSAVLWSIFWIATALVFGGYLYIHHGENVASLYITGYVLEKALSVDNLFVMMAIFSWFAVPNVYRHRLLYWGIIGAIVFRAIFVVIGTGLLVLGPWVEMLFAVIVAFTGVMMLRSGGDDDEIEDYSSHFAYRFARKLFPSYPKLSGNRFLLNQKELDAELTKPENADLVGKIGKGMFYATPLFLCVVVIELSDVMFAFDSVPAVIAVSREPLIVYSAMMFAILGLRTLYFVLEAMKQYLVHLEKAIIALLFFIAAKLALNASAHLFGHGYSIDPTTSLFIVLGMLAFGVLASLIWPERIESDSEPTS
ncbi:TerC/Alx family metal homeostasis membrane protein [Jinshanibacter sp. LJY008]|uniref:TerC/Alx family metal homeostasis membrane protein n=1 Tax=Limnobaculum eriocheiris TaxID=2897391 RepID=A0A9X1MV73_9GAMM|nr:TerC/Alx family metal homeostasis membrane protein [Limnobaculum eriocheiris]MCD1125228.1 TerC/Alx family metal homeostasis membrane protein [Limnobaculum eriocheiris]